MTNVRQMATDPAWREALAKGDMYYVPAKPCGRTGHSHRYVNTGVCVECTRTASRNRGARRVSMPIDDTDVQRELSAITGNKVVST